MAVRQAVVPCRYSRSSSIAGERHGHAAPVTTKKNAPMAATASNEPRKRYARTRRPGVSSRSSLRLRRPAHDRRVRRFRPETERGYMSVPEIDRQDLDDGQRQRNARERKGEVRDQLRDVRGQDVGQELPDVLEDGAPFFDRPSTMLAKLSSSRTMSDGFACDVGPREAHRDADIGGPQRRRVVHAVAGHGDDLALALKRCDDAQLLIGGDARDRRSPARPARAAARCRRDGRDRRRSTDERGRRRTSPISRAIASAV